MLAHLPCTLTSVAREWFTRSHRALVWKCSPSGSTQVPNSVGVDWSTAEIWEFKFAKIAILRFSSRNSSSSVPNTVARFRLAWARKYSPGGSTQVPNLVEGRWSAPEIWEFKLAKIAILRRSDIRSSSIAPKWVAKCSNMTTAPLSATSIRAKCEKIFLHESHPTPDVVFLYVNINMNTAVLRATKKKNVRIWVQFSWPAVHLGPPYLVAVLSWKSPTTYISLCSMSASGLGIIRVRKKNRLSDFSPKRCVR